MRSNGFTLIELLVTIGIMAVIVGVTLANHSKFGGQIMLRNLAYETALAIREAQTYGVSVRKLNKAGITDFEAGYGIHFDTSDNIHYILFSDVLKSGGISGEDGIYNGNVLELVNTYLIGKGYKLNKFCVVHGGAKTCKVFGIDTATLDILFKRPEPDAYIRLNGVKDQLYEHAEIELISPRGDTMRVLVEVSGQISVQK